MMTAEGWTWLVNATKWHYFVDGRSLCGRWMTFVRASELEPDTGPGPDDCRECRRRLDKRQAAARREQDGGPR